MNDIDKNNFLNSDEFFIKLEKKINEAHTSRDARRTSIRKYFIDIKNTKNLRIEIIHDTHIINGDICVLDHKNIIRYGIDAEINFRDKKIIFVRRIQKRYQIERKISRDELLAKRYLHKFFYIFEDNRIYYEDDKDAFEITAKSFFEDQKDYHLCGCIVPTFDTILFSFDSEKIINNYGYSYKHYFCIAKIGSVEAKIIEISDREHYFE